MLSLPGTQFYPWFGNLGPTICAVQPKKKKKTGEGKQGLITKGHEETFENIRYTHHPDYGDSFKDISIFQNLNSML